MSTGNGDRRHGHEPLLRLDGVNTYYGLAHVLQGVSLEVGAGELVTLLGRNGAGKTTTLRSIMGLATVKSGSISFDGQSLRGRTTEGVARLGISYVPEDRRMFAGLTVTENLRLAALGARVGRDQEKRMFDRVWEVFPDLQEHAERDAGHLSGGQQQMVAIGRALIGGSRLLLIDEPTQGLAPRIAADIGENLAEIARGGTGVLLVEQNSAVALELAEYAYMLDQGVVRMSGAAAEIRDDPEIQQRYLAL